VNVKHFTLVLLLLYVCLQLNQKYVKVLSYAKLLPYIQRAADLISKLCVVINQVHLSDDGYSYSAEDFCGLFLNETDFNRLTVLLLVITTIITTTGHTEENVLNMIVKSDGMLDSWYAGYTMLGVAIATGNAMAVAALIEINVNINHRYKNQTPLFHSVKNIKPVITELLVSAGADINAPSLNSGTYCVIV
jgi:ankyrin repeat protein